MSTKILLIRHGETLWNAEDRIQGQYDVQLSATGVEQAKLLNLRFKILNLGPVYSSNLKRSLETAQIALDARREEIQTSSALRERHFGRWEGLLWSEVLRQFPKEAEQFLRDPVGFTPPGGEPWLKMQERAFQEVSLITQRHPEQSVVVFTHGGPIKAIILKALGIEPQLWRQLSTLNASLSVLELKAGVWRLIALNDTCHLNNPWPKKEEPIG